MNQSCLTESSLLKSLGAMECEQQNPHHCGTVWEHTVWVVEKLMRDGAGEAVIKAAWLHDAGKMEAKQVLNNGRAIFPGHAAISARIAEEYGESDYVVNLIRFHDASMDYAMGKPVEFDVMSKLGRLWCNDLLLLMEADLAAQHPTFKMEQKKTELKLFAVKLSEELNKKITI